LVFLLILVSCVFRLGLGFSLGLFVFLDFNVVWFKIVLLFITSRRLHHVQVAEIWLEQALGFNVSLIGALVFELGIKILFGQFSNCCLFSACSLLLLQFVFSWL